MGEAIERTSRLYPGLLENDQNLLFMLKCRQFVEMINGSDVEICHRKSIGGYSPSSFTSISSSRPNSPIQTSVIQSTKNYSNKTKQSIEEMNQNNTTVHNGNNCINNELNVINSTTTTTTTEDTEMEIETTDDVQNGHHSDSCNGKTNSSNGYQNGTSHSNSNIQEGRCDNEDEEMGTLFLNSNNFFSEILSF